MKLLLDGYNILKKIKHASYINDAERQKFIKQLNNYAHKKKLFLIIVFDGGPFTWPMHEKVSQFAEVVYSGTLETADDYIKSYLDQKANQDIMLISSDRELVKHARHHSVLSLDSYDFSQLLQSQESPLAAKKKSTKSDGAQKLTSYSNKEIDMLMERLNPKAKEEEDSSKREKQGKISKTERKILQKIKKL